MCGIALSIRAIPRYTSKGQPHEDDVDPLFDSLVRATQSRGPDVQNTYQHLLPLSDSTLLEVKLSASVLGLRGRDSVAQPMVGKRGVLAWNGQVFQGLDIPLDRNDTATIFERLESGDDPLQLLSSLEGPYAFVYLDFMTETLYFQLDPLSRRSLLIHPPNCDEPCGRLLLSSVRSAEAREAGVEMRVMGGGEGGTIHLRDISTVNDALDFSQALKSHELQDMPGPSSPWAQLQPINTTVPHPGEDLDCQAAGVENFTSNLLQSVRRRIENIPHSSDGHARVAVLFSGGVDCTLLALLIHQCLPSDEPIDLLNVAFERASPDSSENTPSKGKEPAYQVPDRISGTEACEELRSLAPNRQWRFIAIDITIEEALAAKQDILDTMYPASTEMDLIHRQSLAYPLYFASRGRGVLYDLYLSGGGTEYITRAKVFISGLGADEQLGGYSRHRTAYRIGGWNKLVEELQLDITRLPTRNLSRDDRILSRYARDARYPYLDLAFVSYLSNLPISVKMDPTMDSGGDKRLLRLAAEALGLRESAWRAKRAMQFGTRSSRIGGRVKGAGAGKLQLER